MALGAGGDGQRRTRRQTQVNTVANLSVPHWVAEVARHAKARSLVVQDCVESAREIKCSRRQSFQATCDRPGHDGGHTGVICTAIDESAHSGADSNTASVLAPDGPPEWGHNLAPGAIGGGDRTIGLVGPFRTGVDTITGRALRPGDHLASLLKGML